MPLYTDLPGMNITINDQGIELPVDINASEAILIIAPNGSSTAYAGLGNVVDPVAVTSQADFGTATLGNFNVNNYIARMWKQAYDAGCRNIFASPLYGTTTQQQYEYLHDFYTILEDQIEQDIVLIGGVYADSTLSGAPTLVKYTTNPDYSARVEIANARETTVTAEVVQEGGDETSVNLANFPVTNVVLTHAVDAVDAEFDTGAITPIGDNNATGITMIFAGCTATVKSDATPVAVTGSATEGEITIANSATAETTAQAFIDVFDAIKANSGSAIETFTFEMNGTTDGVLMTIPGAIAATYNDELITGIATITNNAVTTEGSAAVPTILEDNEFELNTITGAITLDTAIADGETLYATYDYYTLGFASQLAGFCETVSAKNNQLLGVISLPQPTSITDLATIKAYVDGYLDGDVMQYSKLLSVIGGAPLTFSLGGVLYSSMIHGAYAGYMSVLPSFSALTHKVIPGVLFDTYTLSTAQLLGLTNKHIVCPRKNNGRILFGDAITTAADGSDFVRLTTVRIVDQVVTIVKNVSEPYIGEPNTLARRGALDTQLREQLTGLVRLGALNAFRFHIKSTLKNQIDGDMYIYMELVPVFETRRIMVSISLRAALD